MKKSEQAAGSVLRYDGRRGELVPVTTLDALIARYGTPSFIKIDVEGYEYQVLRGLTRPVPLLSFEFAPEALDSTVKCLEHLQRLGRIQLNYSLEESMQFASEEWMNVPRMTALLASLDKRLFGDVYVRFEG